MITAQITGDSLASAALGLMSKIEERFLRPEGDYNERWLATSGGQDVAYNWSVGVWLEAMVEASRRSDAWRKKTSAYLERVDRYWVDTGFGVLPGSQERYYDDNAWMALALANAAEVTGDARWRIRALGALDFALSGEDSRLGGGIFWKEPQKQSKHSCSNAPTIVGCLVLGGDDPKYREAAIRLYVWTRSHLRDSKDGLYWDNIRLDGSVEKTKWSYNSGLMLRAAHLLFKLTKDKKYAQDASQIIKNGWKKWADEQSGEFRDEGRFAHLFLDAAWQAGDANQRAKVRSLIARIASQADANGFYGKRWYKTSTPPSSYELIDQASMVRALWIAARG